MSMVSVEEDEGGGGIRNGAVCLRRRGARCDVTAASGSRLTTTVPLWFFTLLPCSLSGLSLQRRDFWNRCWMNGQILEMGILLEGFFLGGGGDWRFFIR